jgi:hypothetical protein
MTINRHFISGVLLSAATTAALVFLTGAKAPATRFDEIDVGRINVREPDGTLRMVISNRAQFPGSPWKGSEVPRPERKQFAGMLFVNDEGTENGGLIQKGFIGPDGRASAGVSLTFDRFRQDQVMQLLHAEDGGKAFSVLSINDEADGTKFDVMQRAERMKEIRQLDRPSAQSAFNQMRDSSQLSRNRVKLGTTMDGAAALSLADPQGRPRLMLIVSSDGVPSIQMFDESGDIQKTIRLDADSDQSEPKKPDAEVGKK